MARCKLCHKESITIAKTIGFCLHCIRQHFTQVWPSIQNIHRQVREHFNLPPEAPHHPDGIACHLCLNECEIPEGGSGLCGLRYNKNGKLSGGTKEEGNLSWYYDPLPTNCVADWVCPGGTGAGFPRYAYRQGPEYGYKNLAVFYQACSFNCLFCQNWHYRESIHQATSISAFQLAAQVDKDTSCICFFGGDPTPQLPHALSTSQLALERNRGRILRICWETNGSMKPSYLDEMSSLSLQSGGCIKCDLKAWSKEVHLALCGVDNKRVFSNFQLLSSRMKERHHPPTLIASTLLIPGYIDEEEVAGIARFISSLNHKIPYSLLAFHPQFLMGDLPTTSKRHALACKQRAEEEGLQNVRIGNLHLLGNDY